MSASGVDVDGPPVAPWPPRCPGALVAGCDLGEALHPKRTFDVVGHDGRADVLRA